MKHLTRVQMATNEGKIRRELMERSTISQQQLD